MEKYRVWQHCTDKLTYHDVCCDIAVHVGVIVECQAGIWTTLVLADVEHLQHWTRSVHQLSSESPLKLSRRIGLCWAEHGQIGSSGKGSRVLSIHCYRHVIWTIWENKTDILELCKWSWAIIHQANYDWDDTVLLTADCKVYWITGAITDRIEHATPERSLVVAGHINYCESGVSVGELNSVGGCNLRAAVHPEERDGGSRGDGARNHGWTIELHQVGLIGCQRHIWNDLCGRQVDETRMKMFQHTEHCEAFK